MSANPKWTAEWRTVVPNMWDNYQYDNVSPCCGVDSRGNVWTVVCEALGEFWDTMRVRFCRGDKQDLLDPGSWESKAYIEFPWDDAPGAGSPMMLVDDQDNLYAWWYAGTRYQAVQGVIDAESGSLALGSIVDLADPYVDGFSSHGTWGRAPALAVDPQGTLWLATVHRADLHQPIPYRAYGSNLPVGTYKYAVSYKSDLGELGCGPSASIATREEAAAPTAPPGSFGEVGGGSFSAGVHYFAVTFCKEEGESDDGETTLGPTGFYNVQADGSAITMNVPIGLMNGKTKVYYQPGGPPGDYYLIAITDTSAITIPGPVTSGPTPPLTGTLSERRVRLAALHQGPPGTTARNVYRTQAGGSTFGFVDSVDNNVDTGWYDRTGGSIGAPPPSAPSTFNYHCIAVGRSNSPRTWDGNVTWEKACGWSQNTHLGTRCGLVALGGGLAAVAYTNGTLQQYRICARRRSTGGVWGDELDVAILPSGGSLGLGALMHHGGTHLAYRRRGDSPSRHSEWYYAPLSVSDSGVSMGTPVKANQAWPGDEEAPLVSWADSAGVLAMHGGVATLHVYNIATDGEVEVADSGVPTDRPAAWWITAPHVVPGEALYAVYSSGDSHGVLVWTPTDRDDDCDEDECKDEEQPGCGSSASEMRSSWVGNGGGPSGGAPGPGISGYIGGTPVTRLVGSTVDLDTVTNLRISDSSGKVWLRHPTTAAELKFCSARASLDPFGWNWTHNYHITLTQQSPTTVDVRHEGGRSDRYYLKDSTWTPIMGRRSSLVQNPDGTWTETTPYGAQYQFGATSGDYPRVTPLASMADANGNLVTLSYTDSRLESVLDAFGQRLTFTYRANGCVSAVENLAGLRTTFSYDANSDLESVLHPDGARVTYAYDLEHDVTSIQDPLGYAITLSYTGTKRLRTVTDRSSTIVRTVTYDLASARAVITDALGRVWTNCYDANQRPTQRVDPMGKARMNEWTADLDATAFLDGRGNRWTYTYDSLHRRTGMISPLLCVHSHEYNSDNMPTVYVDPLGNRTTYQYDSQRNRILDVHPDGGVVSYSYYPDAPYGRLREVQDAQGYYTTYAYDARGNLRTTLRPDGTVVTFSYSARNQLESTTDPLGHTITSSYDVMGRLTEVQDPLGNRTTYVYDPLGRQIAVVDPLGNRTTTQYDTLGQVEAQVDALGNRVTHFYDGNGNRTSTTDPLGKVTTFVYDTRDRLVAEVNPLGATTSYDYDENGNQRAVIDPLGKRTTTSYDAVNRPTVVTDPLDHSVETLYYTTGWVKATVDQLGNRTTYSYDGMGRQREVLDALGNRTTYSYDLNGNQTEVQDARGNRWTSVYDCLNRLTASIDPSGAITTHSYDLAGRRAATLHPGGGRTSYSYDAANRQIAVSSDEG